MKKLTLEQKITEDMKGQDNALQKIAEDFGNKLGLARTRMLETLIGKPLLKKLYKVPKSIEFLVFAQPSPTSSITQNKQTIKYRIEPENAQSKMYELEILETVIIETNKMSFILSGKNLNTGRTFETVKKV